MKPNVFMTVFLIGLWFLPCHSYGAKPALPCRSVLTSTNLHFPTHQQRVESSFKKAFASVYRESLILDQQIEVKGVCTHNTLSLLQLFSQTLADFKPSEARVLVIAPLNWFTSEGVLEMEMVLVRNSRYKHKPQFKYRHRRYHFHVVLEYNGKIFDLDYSNKPTPLKKIEYLSNNFFDESEYSNHSIDKPRQQLYVIPLTGDSLINLDPIDFIRTKTFFEFIKDKSYLPLTDYLSEP